MTTEVPTEEDVQKELQEIRDRARQLESDEDITQAEAFAKAKAEIQAEKETDQGDDTDPELKEWKESTAAPVAEIGKSRDELILERLMDNIFDPGEATKYTKALFYGDMGTSKTVAACDAGGMKVLLVAIETGAKSLRNHPEIMQHVKVMKVKSVNQVELLAEQLQKGAFPEFEVIVLDTFSELQKMDLDIMVDEGYTQDTSKNRWTPEGKMYQGNTEHLRRIAASFRNVDRNVVFVTHEREDQDDNSRLYWRPDLTPKVAKTLATYMDIIVRLTAEVGEKGEPRFQGQCRRTTNVTAKTRIGALPSIIDTPTFKIIHDADQKFTAAEKAKAGNN